MSGAVENIIVGMGFDSSQFQSGIKVAMGALDMLKGNLNFGAGRNGLDEVAASAGRFNLNPVNTVIDGVNAKFLAMSTVGVTALSNITTKVQSMATNTAKSLTLGPITDGLDEYELNMNSIQTILANTQASGANLDDVNNALDTLNTYADNTKYSFSEMAKNIGTFTAAGVDLDTSTQSIKGIANIAALSGSNSEQASTAMYQLSQAISAGKVGLQDWNSVVNAGMGGTVFQRALATTAQKMGKLSDGAVTLEGDMQNVKISGDSFRESIQGGDSWLSSDVLTTTLKEFTGDMTDAELAAIGFNETEIKNIKDQAKTAKMAATEAKTFKDMFGSLKEGIGSGWAQSWRTIIGDFKEGKALWTGVSNTLGGIFLKQANARNAMLNEWKSNGGRDALLGGLTNIWHSINSIIAPIKLAFREIFPKETGANLAAITKAFQSFTDKLRLGFESSIKLQATFRGVFALFHIGVEIVKGLFAGIGHLFEAFKGGGGGILDFTAKLGNWLMGVDKAITKSEIFKNFFITLANFIATPIQMLTKFGSAIAQVWSILAEGNFVGGLFEEDSPIVDWLFKIREAISQFGSAVGSVGGIFGAIGSAFSQFWNILSKGDFVSGVFAEDSPIIDWMFKIRDGVRDFFGDTNIKTMLGIGTGLGVGAAGVGGAVGISGIFNKIFGNKKGGLLATVKDALKSISGSFDSIGKVFDGLTDSLKTMQQNVKATVLLKIAIAIGILALSLKLLASMSIGDLAKSLIAITLAFGLLLGAMTIMSKVAQTGGIAQLPLIGLALMALAGAILILSVAMKLIASMSWEEMFRGLTGLALMIGALVAASYGLSKSKDVMIQAAIALIPMAIAINILVFAVKGLASMDWGDMIQGIVGLTGVIIGMSIGLRMMPNNMLAIGLGLLMVSGAISVLVIAIRGLGTMDVEVLRQGLIGMGIALVGIGIALNLMPTDMLAVSAGLLIVSVALLAISKVIQSIGGMSVGDLVKGLVGLGASLAILAVSLSLMSGTIAGSAALAIAAVALALLLPSILALSHLSWGDLIKGMVGLAGVFGVLGVASLVLGIISPLVMALAVALVLMGAGLLAIGLGALAFSAALTAIAKVSELGHDALIKMADVIPMMAAAFANGVIAFATTLADGATQLAEAVGELVIAMLDEFIVIIPKVKEVILALILAIVDVVKTAAPQIGEAVTVLIQTFIDVITTNAPLVWDKVYEMMMGFLDRIRDRIPEVADIVVAIIEQFLTTLADSLDRVVRAGMKFVIDFLNNTAQAIRDNKDDMAAAMSNLGTAIIEGFIAGINAGVGLVKDAIVDMGKKAIGSALNIFDSHSPSRVFEEIGRNVANGLAIGIANGKETVGSAIKKLAEGTIAGFTKSVGKELRPAIKDIFDTIRTGQDNVKFYGPNSPLYNQIMAFRKGLKEADLQLAAFFGRVNLADPKSVEDYNKIAGDSFLMLEGALTGLEAAADSAFGKLEEGISIDRLLEDGDILRGLFDAITMLIPGPEAMLVRILGDVVDTIFKLIFGQSLFEMIGWAVGEVIRQIAGLFGIEFPPQKKAEDLNKELETFLVNVEEADGRFNKLSNKGIENLVGKVNAANAAAEDLANANPVITPVLDLDQFNKDKATMLSTLSTDVSANKAASIAASQQGSSADGSTSGGSVTNINLTQNNTSPVALDHVEIYKQTKSQVSLAKEALSVS